GMGLDPTQNINGTIDEVKIYNISLTAEQVLALYQNRTDLIVSQETNVREVWNATITPNDGTEDGATVWSNSLTIENTAPTQGTPILNSTSGNNYTTDNLTVYNVSTADADSDNVKNIFNWYMNGNSLTVLNMPFEGGSTSGDTSPSNGTTKDYSPYSNNGTVVANLTNTGPQWNSTGGYDGNGAYQFDGIDDQVDFGNDNSLNLSEQITISFWVKSDNPNDPSALTKYVTKGKQVSWEFRAGAGSRLDFAVRNDTADIEVDSGVIVKDGIWYHIVGTMDSSSNVSIYVNGILKETTEFSGTWQTTTQPVRAGWGDTSTRFFNGSIDDIMIFNRTLTAQQILALYQNRTDLIVSQEINLGNVWNATVTPNDGTEDGTTAWSNSLTIVQNGVLPNSSNFDGKTTDFTAEPDLTSVNQPVLEDITYGLMKWLNNNLGVSGADFNTHIRMGRSWVYVDSANLPVALNSSTNITLYNLPFNATPVVREDGDICTDCVILSYIGKNLTFNVSHFTNYSASANSNLTIWDQNDTGMPYGDQGVYLNSQINFYANYTNITSGLQINDTTGAICNITFNVTPTGPFNMIFNITKKLWEYNKSFSAAGQYQWNVSCYNATGYEPLNTTDDITLFNSPPTQGTPILNSTFGTNLTSENLTVYNVSTFDADGDSVKNIYNWYKNGTSLTVLNMPFEGGSVNGTSSGVANGAKDYSSLGNNGTVVNASWYRKLTPNEQSFYYFSFLADGEIDRISVDDDDSLSFGDGSSDRAFSVSSWIYMMSSQGFYIADKGVLNTNLEYLFFVQGTKKLTILAADESVDDCYIGREYNHTLDSYEDRWIHVTATYNGSGTSDSFKLYIDGQRVDDNNFENNSGSYIAMENLDVPVWIGAYGAGSSQGYIGDVQIWNMSLSDEQILALYNNRTDLIHSEETNFGETYNVTVTPNDGYEDGTTLWSNSLTILLGNTVPTVTNVNITSSSNFNYSNGTLTGAWTFNDADSDLEQGNETRWWVNDILNTTFTNSTIIGADNVSKDEVWKFSVRVYDGKDWSEWSDNASITIMNSPPTHSTPTLNSTFGTNLSTENLTVYNISTSDLDNDQVKNIYNWYKNGTSLTVLNLPFEGGSLDGNATGVPNGAKDYSPYSNNGTLYNAAWNSTSGYDNFGAYEFNGVDDYIVINDDDELDMLNHTFTISTWVKAYASVGVGMPAIVYKAEHYGLALYDFGGGDYRAICLYDNTSITTNQNIVISSDISSNFGSFMHITCTVEGEGEDDINLYINGILDNAIITTDQETRSIDEDLFIGGFPIEGYAFNGTIDDVLLFNTSLSPEQILALYQNRTDLIVSQETNKGEVWNVTITPNDGTEDGTTVWSNSLTIENTAPTAPTLIYLPDGNSTTNRTPTLIWNNSQDDDNENLTYHFILDDNSAFNLPEVNITGINETNDVNTSYLVPSELDVDTTYYWKVRAHDGTEYGAYSSTFNFTLDSYIAISLLRDTINFGNASNGEIVNTTGSDPLPFWAENQGNIFMNVTVTATSFFTSVSYPSDNYQFRIEANETSAFDTSASLMNWTNMTNTSAQTAVINLDWHGTKNDFLAGLLLEVPNDELAGAKNSTITFEVD
ncbi:MAG: LamG domain-containing protein, partial [archaeon]